MAVQYSAMTMLEHILLFILLQHRMDIRNEPVDQTASRIIEALRIFRYSLPQDEASLYELLWKSYSILLFGIYLQ